MVSPDIRPQISPWAFLVNRAYFRCSYYLHYWAKNGFFLRRIKYPVTKKCFNDIIPLKVLLKNQAGPIPNQSV